jgi:precorrin-6B C5,15-methyltransferase / cobalt-precorrin-6B C5,C15-methyltransferase
MDKKISVIGVGLSAEDLSSRALKIIAAAEVLAGGKRLLDYFSGHRAQKVILDRGVEATLRKLKKERTRGNIVVLASGDPNFFGVAPLVSKIFGPERVSVLPNITAFQGAFARAKERWDNASFISLHGRDIAGLQKIFLAEGPVVIYCDDKNTPAAVARRLIAEEPRTARWETRVFENLGQPDERITAGALKIFQRRRSSLLAMMIIQTEKLSDTKAPQPGLGIGDDNFHHDRGLITKRDVRLLSLARLACGNNRVLWDIGAGSGSIAIEAARLFPGLRVFALEQDSGRFAQLEKNIKKFKAQNVTALRGSAPGMLKNLPRPHSVFIGGSGGRLSDILQQVKKSILSPGSMVVNGVTLETLKGAVAVLKAWKWRTTVTAVRLEYLDAGKQPEIFRAENTVFIIHGTSD